MEEQDIEAKLEIKNVPLTGPKARRLGDMAGVYFDLKWTVSACERLMQRSRFLEPICGEALHDCALIRYARCYKAGRRNEFQIPHAWLENLEARLRDAHDKAIALRDKHIAHSINDWEINVPTAEVARAGPAATVRTLRIHQIRASLGRTGLQDLCDLAKVLMDRVHAEMALLRHELLKDARSIAPRKLERLAPRDFPRPALRKVGKDRRRR